MKQTKRDFLKIVNLYTDGKERKWVKVSSVKKKRKRIPPNTKEILLDANIGMKVD